MDFLRNTWPISKFYQSPSGSNMEGGVQDNLGQESSDPTTSGSNGGSNLGTKKAGFLGVVSKDEE